MSSRPTPVRVPKVGQEAPPFNLPDVEMKNRSLEEFRGKKLVMAFFPAADSPVCTTEMCKLRDSHSALESLGAQVVRISVEGPFANKNFAENNHLNFPILSDYKHEVIRRYGIIMANLGDNPLVEPNYDDIKHALEK